MEKITILDTPESCMDEGGFMDRQAPFYLSSNTDSYWDTMVAYSLFDELRFFIDRLYVRRWGSSLWKDNTTTAICMDWEPIALGPFQFYLVLHSTYIEIIRKRSDVLYFIVENTSHNMDILKRW